jgi:hypothetical protein
MLRWKLWIDRAGHEALHNACVECEMSIVAIKVEVARTELFGHHHIALCGANALKDAVCCAGEAARANADAPACPPAARATNRSGSIC